MELEPRQVTCELPSAAGCRAYEGLGRLVCASRFPPKSVSVAAAECSHFPMVPNTAISPRSNR